MDNNESSRKEFEVWAVTNNYNIKLADETSPYTYFTYETETRWIVWQAQISYCGKKITLGVFNNVVDAANAYINAAKKYHGEFAKF